MFNMALRCDNCGKGRTIGKSGAHKYGGKWAMRAVKKTKIWKPNLQSFTVNGKKMKLCTKCIKRVKFEQRKRAEKLAQIKKIPEIKPIEKKLTKPIKKTAKKTSKKSA